MAFKPNFSGYTFKDEMISDAIENCLIYINNFDPKKGNNPFAYYTQIAWYAFVRRINREQKQLMTKYKFIESLDLNSSLLSSTQGHDEEGDFEEILGEEGGDFPSEEDLKRSQHELVVIRRSLESGDGDNQWYQNKVEYHPYPDANCHQRPSFDFTPVVVDYVGHQIGEAE